MNASSLLTPPLTDDTAEKTCVTYFTEQQIADIDMTSIPHHIAIIPDGNRRWAQRQSISTDQGHKNGADIIIETVKAAKELGVGALTFYTFSTENWVRPKEEVDALMWLIETYLIEQRDSMVTEGIRLQTIGDLSQLSLSIRQTIEETKEITSHGKEIDLILAINYGGRDEITRGVKKIVADVKKGLLSEKDIDEEIIAKYLDTSPWQDPELLIRTSGQIRVSNFLIWQISYSEIYVHDVLWPDFSPQHLYQAIRAYQSRDRRLGY